MGLFGKLFGGAREPEKPDDYHLASNIASTIDGFVSTQGLEALISGDWSVGLRKDYGVSLTRMGGDDNTRAIVRLDELEEMSDFKRILSDSLMGDSPLGYMATDKLAMAVLRKIKEQID